MQRMPQASPMALFRLSSRSGTYIKRRSLRGLRRFRRTIVKSSWMTRDSFGSRLMDVHCCIPGGANKLQVRLMVCAAILKRGRRRLVRFGRPCTAPGRAKSSTSTTSGASGPLGDVGLDENGGYSYILVKIKDMSNWVWLEPTGGCSTRMTEQHLLAWCKTIEVPEVWVTATASHFKNHMMAGL